MARLQRRPRTSVALAAIAAGALVLACADARAARLAAQPAIAGEDAAQLLHRLTDPQVSTQAKEAAANRLVTSDDRRALTQVEEVFRSDGPDRPAQRSALLAAIARAAEPSPSLFGLVMEFLPFCPPDLACPAIEALGSYRTKASVEALLGRAAPGRPASERSAAFRALVRIGGHDAFGESYERWSGWYDRLRNADEARWHAALATGLAARADRLATDRSDAVGRLFEVTRRLYLAYAQDALPSEQPKLLASLLTDSREELRSLGFDILSRELSSARPVHPSVQATVVALLRDPSPSVRARAAILVRQLNPPGAVDTVARVLNVEENPETAAALLLAAARWSSDGVRPAAIRWLGSSSETRPAAVQALLTLARSGLLYEEADRAAVAGVLRATEAQSLSPAECRLLVLVGGPSDLARVALLLKGPPSALRTAAAESLAERSEYFEAIADAADRELFEPAVRAVMIARPNADGFAWLLALDAPSVEARRSAAVRIGAVLPTAELLVAARAAEPAIREVILSRLTDTTTPGDATAESLAAGLLMLAEARLKLGEPEGALAAAEAVPNAASESLLGAVLRARTVALVWLGRINEAEDVNGPPDAWLEGLEHAITEPHAAMVAAVLAERFEGVLTPEEAARLEELRLRTVPGSSANGAEPQPTTSPPPGR